MSDVIIAEVIISSLRHSSTLLIVQLQLLGVLARLYDAHSAHGA